MRNKVRRILLFACAFLAALGSCCLKLAPSYAMEDGTTFVIKANSAYEQGQYELAEKLYQRAILLGIDNGHVYYNLANALYRLGRYGAAVANYRRALRQLPYDPDVISNLNLARSHATDRIESEGEGIEAIFERLLFIRPHFSDYSLRLIFLILYLGFCAVLAISPLTRFAQKKTVFAVLGCLMLYWTLITFATKESRTGQPTFALLPGARHIRPAVIAVPQAEVRSGNSDKFQVVFQLHDAAEVEVSEKRDDWIEILLPEGRRGWLKTSDIEIL